MEQDSRSDESRERAVSSEPSSTRPNPFDDGELSARKRQRTSLTGSRSRSVETLPSQDEADAMAGSDSVMKIDTPEPPAPSTPPQSDPLTEPPTSEPHSSKVTINLRNADSLEATPASPPSPTKARSRKHDIKVSVEESEVDMGRAPPVEDYVSSSSSVTTSPDVPVIAIDDDEDDEDDDDPELIQTQSSVSRIRPAHLDVGSIFLEFPYHSADETYYDTVVRLNSFFNQPTAHYDEALHHMRTWFDRYLFIADVTTHSIEAVAESALENRPFWLAISELFWTVYSRRNLLAKIQTTRDFANHFFVQLARLAAHFLAVDARIVQSVAVDEDMNELELISPGFLQCLGNITQKEDAQLYNGYALDNIFDASELLDIFQSKTDGSMMGLARLSEMEPMLLPRFPRKTMDCFAELCHLADSIARDSYQQLSYSPGIVNGQTVRSRKNLAVAVRLFKTISAALDVVIDKYVNNLSTDSATSIITCLTRIITCGLQGKSKDAVELIETHREQHPEVPESFTADTITHEWRFGVLSKLIRSRQMQLRVVAVGLMCTDLVHQWKKYQDSGNESQHMKYLRHLSSFLTNAGLVNYLLGPTCHPEITQESSNIIGFLVVTETYEPAQTDLFWHTMTSTQDPRIAEALARMMAKTSPLMMPEHLAYLNEKLYSLPIDAFTPYMRELCDNVIKNTQNRNGMNTPLPITPYKLCVRLMQEASIYGPQGSIAQPDIHAFAAMKLKDLLQYNVNDDIRQELLMSCVGDIASKSLTTSGSLHALHMTIRNSFNRDLAILVTDHEFARLLVDELEATIAIARDVGFMPVYATVIGQSRRELILHTIINHGEMIDNQHGRQLWDLLVGEGAACQEDRKMAWQQLNLAAKRVPGFDNPFMRTCLTEYLPKLPPRFYYEGALEFVREALVPIANDANGTVLDEQGSVANGRIELLWQMILTAPAQSIEAQAIHTLVNDIYVNSRSIISFPLHRARKVHFALVNRCLQQLAAVAEKLKTSSDATASGDDDPMVIVPNDSQQKEHELKFVRSLAVLRAFLKTLHGKSHFAAPDLRSLMLQSPSDIEGESAELKFQSFDGNEQTDVKPLTIGRQNTAASLLASIREATGFDNYRIFYRGIPLTPTEDQICKSLEDLDIHNGLILVKRESDAVSSPVKVKPGASPLEIEILGHFKELWEYLSMDEKLAREIYQFLVKLPADESVLNAFEDASTSYRQIFPLGEPFKCLYTIHALREYLSTRRLKSQAMQVNTQNVESQQKTALDQEEALLKAMSLLVDAICDPDVVTRCPGEPLQVLLSFHLVDNFVQLLKGKIALTRITFILAAAPNISPDAMNTDSAAQLLTPELQDRLLSILTIAARTPSQTGLDLISRSIEALLECCARSSSFWAGFRQEPAATRLVQELLFTDNRPFVRKNVAKLISNKALYSHGDSGAVSVYFAEMFWPVVFELLPQVVKEPSKCEEVLNLSFSLVKKLAEANSPALDLQGCLTQCGELILNHTSLDDISHPERNDIVAHGLVSILHYGLKLSCARNEHIEFPATFPRTLFYEQLFPLDDEDGPLVPHAVLNPQVRTMLCEIVYALSKDNPDRYHNLLADLDGLTPYDEKARYPYKYELPQLFERSKAVRSPCGYPGLRNLSNTCYLNSLFTQLFMNTGFRRFVLEQPILNPHTSQLLAETQTLFAGLQDSVRRFIDPQPCVEQIMTYDEAPIDIHNQMDVDEFYNLLFDRWEAQMPGEHAKRALKSFYGGQLVQQVKSKECEHISERMEPFSAIQCDIKGIASLKESLQAYVDGEIMEGDNKYKCETCDRHVDAVKRACLKNVPDNLIFHLKRFDFNLRTLQRSKINDRFTFPTKIDMQPYTVEHLSDPSSEAEPDIFELVGVLVHAGTAESGHYYSFIRERPNTSDQETWVEFNDDSVSSWDPALLENACFGGPDYRSSFDNNGAYEKSYSAYMLFYQRSSSLEKEQESLKQSGKHSPLRFDLPPDLEYPVKAENWAIVHRHVLNDPYHIPFVHKVLANTWEEDCSDGHQTENLAMRIALGHLDQVASRAKEAPDFAQLYRVLVQMCQRCPHCCFCFFYYFDSHPEALRFLLQKNADQPIRQEIGSVLCYALRSLKQNLPSDYDLPEEQGGSQGLRIDLRRPCALAAAVCIFQVLWETFHTSLRAWPEYFGTMADFASLGRPEAAALLEEDFLAKLIMIITADPSHDLSPQYARMMNAISRRNRPPSYENIIALIDILMDLMDPRNAGQNYTESSYGRLQLALEDEPIPYTAKEVNIFHNDWARNQSNVFVDKLLQINQNHVATDAIINRLMEFSPMMDQKIFVTVRHGITGQPVQHFVAPYLRAAASYIRASSNADNVERLITHICSQCRNLSGAEGMAFFEFFKEIFDSSRRTEEDFETVLLHSLTNLSRWAPGLLGYHDRNVSYAIELFLKENLWQYGPSPAFGENEQGLKRSQSMTVAAKQLTVSCLVYLQDTYVARGAQAPKDTVAPLDRTIRQGAAYFGNEDERDDGILQRQYSELMTAVMEPIGRLIVDEIEEDGSDWDGSIGSSDQMDSLADLSMQANGELHDGE
ncbi:ubiquitin carboxyl-terminal hydrolase [Xylariales sp. AK1849]|nr:ubiquitin carboxyl-terminal hydrolase [Xylariales sp. AK1849]